MILQNAIMQAWDEHQIITQMFYGKAVEVFTAQEENGEPVFQE
jgi:hypothetical protein